MIFATSTVAEWLPATRPTVAGRRQRPEVSTGLDAFPPAAGATSAPPSSFSAHLRSFRAARAGGGLTFSLPPLQIHHMIITASPAEVPR